MLDRIPDGWQAAAECRDADPDVFFPATGDDHIGEADAEPAARRYCDACPVRITCLEHALDLGRSTVGIWGGLHSGKRRHLIQARSRQRAEGHSPHRYTPGCSCTFCRDTAAHLAGEPIDTNTPGATHGRLSTYGRGCHCTACTLTALLRSRRDNLLTAS